MSHLLWLLPATAVAYVAVGAAYMWLIYRRALRARPSHRHRRAVALRRQPLHRRVVTFTVAGLAWPIRAALVLLDRLDRHDRRHR